MTVPLVKSSYAYVSDHAVLRWLERVEGIDLAMIREAIRKAATEGLPSPDGAIHFGNGSIIVDGNKIITILAKGQRPAQSGKTARRRKRERGATA